MPVLCAKATELNKTKPLVLWSLFSSGIARETENKYP